MLTIVSLCVNAALQRTLFVERVLTDLSMLLLPHKICMITEKGLPSYFRKEQPFKMTF